MPQISWRKRKYNLFKRLFISSIYNRIAHEILFDDSNIGSQEEANINFFALNLLETINNRYSDRAPTYAPRSYAVLNATQTIVILIFYYIFEWRRQHIQSIPLNIVSIIAPETPPPFISSKRSTLIMSSFFFFFKASTSLNVVKSHGTLSCPQNEMIFASVFWASVSHCAIIFIDHSFSPVMST